MLAALITLNWLVLAERPLAVLAALATLNWLGWDTRASKVTWRILVSGWKIPGALRYWGGACG